MGLALPAAATKRADNSYVPGENWYPGRALVVAQHMELSRATSCFRGLPQELRGARAGQARAVTPDTVFNIASCTKAFTATALAMLVDEGKLKWGEKVSDHLPYFRLADPLAGREATLHDLLNPPTASAGRPHPPAFQAAPGLRRRGPGGRRRQWSPFSSPPA